MALSLVTPPAPSNELLTWQTAQKQLRLDGFEDDADFVQDIVIPAALDRAEIATLRALPDQTWDLWRDGFPHARYIEIPLPPLVSVTYVKYVNTGGVLTTMTVGTDYQVDAPVGPRCSRGRVSLPFAGVWPVTLRQANAVVVRFRCGYVDQSGETPAGPARTLPPLLVSGILMDVGALYDNRESLIDSTRAGAIALPRYASWIYQSFLSHPTQRVDASRSL